MPIESRCLANSPDDVSVILQAIRIGDLGIASIPFEVFTEIGLEIKEKSPLAKSFTIELANGSYGYLPTQNSTNWAATKLGSGRTKSRNKRHGKSPTKFSICSRHLTKRRAEPRHPARRQT